MNPGREPDLKRALRPVLAYERAVREVSKMLAEAEFATRSSVRSAPTRTATGPVRRSTSTSLSATRPSKGTPVAS